MTNIIAKFELIRSLVESVAPESVANLNPGATQQQLALLREVVPFAPQALCELLEQHNGEEMVSWLSIFPDGMQLMDIDHIVEKSRYYQGQPVRFIENLDELVSRRVMEYPLGRVKPVFSYARRVPFAHVNGELLWYFDMDPAEGGTVGQIVYEDAEDLTLRVIADSIGELFDRYIHDLRADVFAVDDSTGQISSSVGDWYSRRADSRTGV